MKADEAFKLGFKSFFSGSVANPFSVGTVNYKEYERGFNKAYFKNLESGSKELYVPHYEVVSGKKATARS